MRIRFLKTDPRAGIVAEMDSSRGHQLVAEGAAEYVDAPASKVEKPAAPAPAPAKPKAKSKGKKS